MSALVKLANESQINRYLNLELAEEVSASILDSRRAVQLQGKPYCIKMAGDQEETDISELKARSRYILEFGQCRPFLYQVIVHVNPELAKLGTFQPEMAIVEPGEPHVIGYTFQPFRDCDLTKLDWHVRMYVLD